jgi:hypothetical protein
LVSEGRRLYRSADYPAALERFQEAVALDHQNEIAQSFLELTEERLRTVSTRPVGSAAAPATASRSTTAPAAVAPTPAPGVARINLTFNSPLSSGAISVTLDGELLAEVPFDFSTRGPLGIRRKGTGTVRRVILTPSGAHRVGVQLAEERRGALGTGSFSVELEPDSRWSLRVDLPTPSAEPSFFLVQSAR